MLLFASTPSASLSPTPQQIADLRLAASQMTGATRRAFQAEMTLKYCDGNARRAEEVFGWGRQNNERPRSLLRGRSFREIRNDFGAEFGEHLGRNLDFRLPSPAAKNHPVETHDSLVHIERQLCR
jgi:predicted Fe-S protein YdhL (DUF1289 family)